MMNPLFKLLLIGVCACSVFLFACQEKKESTAPATKPAVAEKAQKANATEEQVGIDKKDQEQINKIQDMIK
ncbi:MAG: hypothetical protein P4L38_00570 [Syntrophaceae bacterium]|nr:hypothetical protein [Syntrophaceae bacterium]